MYCDKKHTNKIEIIQILDATGSMFGLKSKRL